MKEQLRHLTRILENSIFLETMDFQEMQFQSRDS
jgi:hypothetical protein